MVNYFLLLTLSPLSVVSFISLSLRLSLFISPQRKSFLPQSKRAFLIKWITKLSARIIEASHLSFVFPLPSSFSLSVLPFDFFFLPQLTEEVAGLIKSLLREETEGGEKGEEGEGNEGEGGGCCQINPTSQFEA